MKDMLRLLAFLLLVLANNGCKTASKLKGDDGKITVNLLQINDVYEISPLEGGKAGGMARVATLKKRFAAQNPTLLIHAGDFLSPSVLGTLKYNDGERVRGRQMVEAMNLAGIDIVTFGNHEFDISELEVQARIDESKFEWVSSNVKHLVNGQAQPFVHKGQAIPEYLIKQCTDSDGTVMKIGFFGVTLPSNRQTWLQYEDLIPSAQRICNQIKDSVDMLIGITHQEIDEDEAMAKAMQFIPLFIGGHDHNSMDVPIGTSRITKADANAKTMYLHQIALDKKSHKKSITSELISLNAQVLQDTATQALVERWEAFGLASFQKLGIDPKAKIKELEQPLDAREVVVRGGPSAIGKLCAEALTIAATETQFAVFNTGSIRIDDILIGTVTQYDVLRILPFGGKILDVEISGRLIEKAVKIGVKENIGKGGYFVLNGIEYQASTDQVLYQNAPLVAEKFYRVAMPEYLMTGKETGLGFLQKGNAEIKNIVEITDPNDLRFDIRKALIERLKRN
jgi:2',3'-cyclic-nucleotide 2'-phosphodiesterase (5'-nucleotidase family)